MSIIHSFKPHSRYLSNSGNIILGSYFYQCHALLQKVCDDDNKLLFVNFDPNLEQNGNYYYFNFEIDNVKTDCCCEIYLNVSNKNYVDIKLSNIDAHNNLITTYLNKLQNLIIKWTQ